MTDQPNDYLDNRPDASLAPTANKENPTTPHEQLVRLREVLPEGVLVKEIVSYRGIWMYANPTGGANMSTQHMLDLQVASAERWLHGRGFTTGTTSDLYYDQDMIGHRWIKCRKIVSVGQCVPALIEAVEWQVKNG